MDCAYHEAGLCRSCTQLHVPYAGQLAAKDAHARSLLATHDGVQWLPPVASRESGFRNRAKMVVGGTSDEPVLGILVPRGETVDLTQCALYPASMQASFPAIARFIQRARLEPYDIAARRGELKYVLLSESGAEGALMLRFVCRSQEPLARLRKHLASLLAELPRLQVVSLNLQPAHAALLEGEREILLTGQSRIAMDVGGLTLFLQPQGFFQTNAAIATALYAQAREWVAEAAPASAWDLYCGVGGFALHCAGEGRIVTGVEERAEAVECARASRALAGIEGVEFVTADSTAFALASREQPGLVIVNPPRRGIGGALAAWLDASSVRWLVYSSCNAESLATDLARMPAFALRRARVFDMFPHTRHYETLALLQRRA